MVSIRVTKDKRITPWKLLSDSTFKIDWHPSEVLTVQEPHIKLSYCMFKKNRLPGCIQNDVDLQKIPHST